MGRDMILVQDSTLDFSIPLYFGDKTKRKWYVEKGEHETSGEISVG